jgi:hypothetical protein
VLLDQPVGQHLTQVHGAIFALGKGDQSVLLVLGEHFLERRFRVLHPLAPKPLTIQIL